MRGFLNLCASWKQKHEGVAEKKLFSNMKTGL
jgi:hypothetical protein